MTTVEQATATVLANCISLGDEAVPLAQATGRTLRENLVADRDFPPFNRASMDGIAIVWEKFGAGQRSFPVQGLQAAGAPQMFLENETNCLEIMTGAILPAGADTVVRYEDLLLENGVATIQTEAVKRHQNIHWQGTDRAAGSVIVPAGCEVSPAEISVVATVGKTELLVARLPRVAVISTGDELVDIHETPLPHQIRRSNAHALAASLAGWGVAADLLHLPDEQAAIRQILSVALGKYDALLLSGGVSMGKLDFVPGVLAELGVAKLFHQVSQRPGKPFWFGRAGDTVVFAFPGNPVSTFLCLHRYFHPWLRSSLGLPALEERCAELAADFHFKPDLTYFLQVKTAWQKNGKLTAQPVEGRGSGDLANLVDADAFLELPAGRDVFRQGEVYPILFFR